jgi:transposase
LRQSERRSRIEELHLTGATVPVIAATVGCHVNSVRSWLIRRGYTPNAARRGGDHGGGSAKVAFPVEQAWQMFCEGASPYAVGKHFGVKRATVVRRLQAVYGMEYLGRNQERSIKYRNRRPRLIASDR